MTLGDVSLSKWGLVLLIQDLTLVTGVTKTWPNCSPAECVFIHIYNRYNFDCFKTLTLKQTRLNFILCFYARNQFKVLGYIIMFLPLFQRKTTIVISCLFASNLFRIKPFQKWSNLNRMNLLQQWQI